MSTCCKTTNLLRRDGTSQKQRFPLALAENYVKIDERSHADLLNFVLELADEIHYYGASNTIDGQWVEFFKDDLSFVLAQVMRVRANTYREAFGTLLSDAETALESGFAWANIQSMFAFLVTGTMDAPSLPKLLTEWIAILPESALFASNRAYSFRDLVADGKQRLQPVINKLYAADVATSSAGGTSLADWTDLETAGWSIPVLGSGDTSHYDSGDLQAGSRKVLELLKAAFDSFFNLISNLQAEVPRYMLQSLEEFPWHNPQNGLLLAFIRLFDHARDHLNQLTRRHLMYQYMDVLRFSQQALTPDQAVVIMQLRKGTERHRLEKGTLLKAGKDADGKSLYYAVNEETVVNQAQVKALRSVFVEYEACETIGATDANCGSCEVNDKRIVGVYASPVANSADGLGAALSSKDPKWNMFGEAQLAKLPADRSMPDAKLGFMIASPLIKMKEGDRVINLTFVVPENQFPISDEARELLALNLSRGLNVEYTSAKAWTSAKLSRVLITNLPNKLDDHNLQTGILVGSTSSKVAINLEVTLDEGDEPVVVYNEKVHKELLKTPWPVMRFFIQGQSDDYAHPDFNLPLGFNQAEVLAIDELFANESLGAEFVAGQPYTAGQKVSYHGAIYQALVPINQSLESWIEDANPLDYPELWSRIYRTHLYDALVDLQPETMHLQVDVKGAFGLLYENDFGRLKGEKPFPIFGGAPVIGSRFYIGSQEIFGKHLDQLDFEFIWQDVPEKMGLYFKKYDAITASLNQPPFDEEGCPTNCICCTPSLEPLDEIQGVERLIGGKVPLQQMEAARNDWQAEAYLPTCDVYCPSTQYSLLGNGDWQADIHFLYDGEWQYLGREPLFSSPDARQKHTITFTEEKFVPFEQDWRLAEADKWESNSPRGFVRFELATPGIAFGHKYYRDLYVDAVTYAIKVKASAVDAPNEPITPIVKEIRLNYISRNTTDLSATAAFVEDFEARQDQLFHIHPFGFAEAHPYLSEDDKISLLPQYREEGTLYIGLEGLNTPSTLSMLFQLAEGSGNSDLEACPLEWFAMMENRQQSLSRKDILFDSTDSLLTSGVMQFDFGKAFQTGNTVLDAGLHWLGLKLNRNTEAYMRAIDIVAQAVLVSFADENNNPSHLEKALPAETINALKVSSPAIKKVAQPYGSFGGKLPEQGDNFITRVSERLRHKQRSINIWDYEHMVLEEFPSIYKVKCLNHTEYKSEHTGKDWEISPGNVTVVCIPDLRNLNAVNPFEPKNSTRIIQAVTKFLEQHNSAWVNLKVKNPQYEAIKVTCQVGFLPGKDPGYYSKELDLAIQRFLSPWAFDHEQEIVFGGKIHRSKIIQMIEQLNYVDFVINFRMDHIVDGQVIENVMEAKAATGRSILVSALEHDVNSVKANCALCIPSTAVETAECCCEDCGDAADESN